MPLQQALGDIDSRESVVFALASHAHARDATLLLVRKLLPLPNGAYVATTAHGAAWQGRALLPILNQGLRDALGILIFHAHPHAGRVALSSDDQQSAQTLLPTLQNTIPARPHGSIVLGKDCCAGMVLLPDGNLAKCSQVRLLGPRVLDLHDEVIKTLALKDNDIHNRQMLLIKGAGQAILQRTKIAVVGLGGGGSHVVQQLAHMGIGTIIGIDGDRADRTNRSRTVGMTALDADLRRKKTAVMARMVRNINAKVKFLMVPCTVPEQQALEALKEADIIIGCLDTFHTRNDVQEIAWRYLIPYIDIGLLIQGPPEMKQVTIGGNVATLIPGQFCQWCIEFLTRKKLSDETDGRPRSYLKGAKTQAQVISFNGLLASQAVSETLQLLTGFAPSDGPEMSVKKFNGLEGTLEKWVVRRNKGCQLCQSALGAGDPVWSKK